ncbi:crossover junction endodeoxyribonuclease RuvC [Streptomyces marianii]|uniref:Crossover junction endodeoxyribonuclease RuvC n=1 Tax=Streptomyces marianii TaxID=1817406 RepID=A0A5R9ED11_9ACTN|nr:crossover junction endodeoxyribonuclease RuvC [Streptomyces marianii]
MTPRPLVVGLDLSLTSTGVAGEGWTDRIRTKLRGDERLRHLVGAVAPFVKAADLVVMEGPSYGHAALAGHEDLAGLRVLVRQFCYRQSIPYAVIPPSTLKLYATGYGKASKGEVRSAVADLYGVYTEGAARYDEADAYVAMAAGMAWLGYPLAAVPERNGKALAGCAWPTTPVAVAR